MCESSNVSERGQLHWHGSMWYRGVLGGTCISDAQDSVECCESS